MANLPKCSRRDSTLYGIEGHDCSVVVSHREEVQILLTARLTGTIFGGEGARGEERRKNKYPDIKVQKQKKKQKQ